MVLKWSMNLQKLKNNLVNSICTINIVDFEISITNRHRPLPIFSSEQAPSLQSVDATNCIFRMKIIHMQSICQWLTASHSYHWSLFNRCPISCHLVSFRYHESAFSQTASWLGSSHDRVPQFGHMLAQVALLAMLSICWRNCERWGMFCNTEDTGIWQCNTILPVHCPSWSRTSRN